MTTAKKIVFGFGFALTFAILVVIGAHSWWQALRSMDTNAWTTHTDEVITDLRTVLSLLRDIEVSQRGYVLTGEEEFLQPSHEASAKLPQITMRIRELTADNLRQQQRLKELDVPLAAFIKLNQRIIEVRKNDREKGFETALALVKKAEGKMLMDQVRDIVAQMEDAERHLLQMRIENANRDARFTIYAVGAGTFLALGMISVGALLAFRAIARRDTRTRALLKTIQRVASEDLALSPSINGSDDMERASEAVNALTVNLRRAAQSDRENRARINQLELMLKTSGESLQQLGSYELLKKLGQGGMGVVYQARHTLLNKMVALKVLSAEQMKDAKAVARFRREMVAVGSLDHPNIVRAHDAGEADGHHFLVMELVVGIDLAKLGGHYGPLAINNACELIRQAAVGLQHAHEHGLVHRDIKPSNLMLTSTGQVKILDLGLARLYEDQPASEALTKSGAMVGTPDYMAPEQGFGAWPVDVRADIYSLGCTLCKLLTGHAPFDRPQFDTPLKKLLAHTQEPVPNLRVFRPEASEKLAALLERLLAKNPAARLGNAAEVATALQSFTSGCGLLALLEPLNAVEAGIMKAENTGSLAASNAGAKATETFENGR
jgi:serine/threonine protein kinase/CHASE3 domain sensor protein